MNTEERNQIDREKFRQNIRIKNINQNDVELIRQRQQNFQKLMNMKLKRKANASEIFSLNPSNENKHHYIEDLKERVGFEIHNNTFIRAYQQAEIKHFEQKQREEIR